MPIEDNLRYHVSFFYYLIEAVSTTRYSSRIRNIIVMQQNPFYFSDI